MLLDPGNGKNMIPNLRFNTNSIKFTKDNKYALVMSDGPNTMNLINLHENTIKQRKEVVFANDEHIFPSPGQIVEKEGYPERLLVAFSFNGGINIYTFGNMTLLYSSQKSQVIHPKNRTWHGLQFSVSMHEDPEMSNHIICWGHHLNIYDIHQRMDGNNMYYQAIKCIKEEKIMFTPSHLETLDGLFTNLIKMNGIHNLVAKLIPDDD